MRTQRVVIIGGGIIGLSTAYALLSQGIKQVTIVEQEAVDHERSTSHGLSRLLRFEYGVQEFYSEMVRLSFHRWKALERLSKSTLYTRTGVLVLGAPGDTFTQTSHRTLQKLGYPNESLTQLQCQQRFPQFALQDYDVFTYNREGGMLYASAALHSLKALIMQMGGTIQEGCRVTRIDNENRLRPIQLHLHTGDILRTDRVVVAAGPWVHKLLGNVQLPVTVTRQYVLYFANLSPDLFGYGHCPCFIVNDDIYGFPIHSTANGNGPAWFKVASDVYGSPVDPDAIPVVQEQDVAETLQKVSALLPALSQATLTHVQSCMYDISPDSDFILDHLPGDSRIVFATGLTGHGFKFGPLLGEILRDLVFERPPALPIDRFRLGRFSNYFRQKRASVA